MPTQSNKSITIYEGVGAKSKKPFSAVRVSIGDYDTLLFPTKIEMAYIRSILQPESKAVQPPKAEEAVSDADASAFLSDHNDPSIF